MKKSLALIALSLFLNACTTSNWYHGMKASEKVQCLNVPQSEYEDCMKNAQESYDEYKEKRKEIKN